jgi:hypothetical protein
VEEVTWGMWEGEGTARSPLRPGVEVSLANQIEWSQLEE